MVMQLYAASNVFSSKERLKITGSNRTEESSQMVYSFTAVRTADYLKLFSVLSAAADCERVMSERVKEFVYSGL